MIETLLKALDSAPSVEPFPHIHLRGAVTPDEAGEMIGCLPSLDDMRLLTYIPGREEADKRRYLELTTTRLSLWRKIGNELNDGAEAVWESVMSKLNPSRMGEHHNMVPRLYVDSPGYRIGVHLDTPRYKAITLFCYIGCDGDAEHHGAQFGNPVSKTIPYEAGGGFAFCPSEETWHRVGIATGRRIAVGMIFYWGDHR